MCKGFGFISYNFSANGMTKCNSKHGLFNYVSGKVYTSHCPLPCYKREGRDKGTWE